MTTFIYTKTIQRRSKRFVWTKEQAHQEAQKCTTRIEFQRGSSSAYQYCQRNNLLDEVCSHMREVPITTTWTRKLVLTEALKYQNRSDFYRGNQGAYQYCLRNAILNEVCSHMKAAPTTTWTKNSVLVEAKQYNTRSDFMRGSNGAYQYCLKNNLLDEVCGHMERGKYGYDLTKPGTLYYLRIDGPELDEPVYKIGVTNRKIAHRIRDFGANHLEIKIIAEWHSTGEEILELEQALHLKFKDQRYRGDDLLLSGNTELFYLDPIGLDMTFCENDPLHHLDDTFGI